MAECWDLSSPLSSCDEADEADEIDTSMSEHWVRYGVTPKCLIIRMVTTEDEDMCDTLYQAVENVSAMEKNYELHPQMKLVDETMLAVYSQFGLAVEGTHAMLMNHPPNSCTTWQPEED